jgi:hypothetical protein
MASKDYWWQCQSCPFTTNKWGAYVSWRTRQNGKRQRVFNTTGTVMWHENENPGHKMSRKVAPGV